MLLFDDYKEHGQTLDGYRDAAKKMDNATKIIPMDLGKLEILNIFSYSSKKGTISCHHLKAGEYEINQDGMFFAPGMLLRISNQTPQKLIQEAVGNETMFRYDGKVYFLGDTLYKTLASVQAGVGGKLLRSPGFERNLALIRQFDETPVKVNAVIREDGRNKKIMAMFKSHYQRTPYVALYDAVKMLGEKWGNLVCYSWEISHRGATIYLEYDDSNPATSSLDIKPGLCLETSDVGYTATYASAVWRVGNFWYVQDQIKMADPVEELAKVAERLQREQEKFGLKMAEMLSKSWTEPVYGGGKAARSCRLAGILGRKMASKVVSAMDAQGFTSHFQEVMFLLNLPGNEIADSFSNAQQEKYKDLLMIMGEGESITKSPPIA